MIEDPQIVRQLTTIEHKKDTYANEVIQDYWICCVSREVSFLSRREVLTGKAKFGITGGGKEVPQVAMARVFKKGDWRSGYYRDQTFVFAIGESSVEDFFAQLYADADHDPFSGGRQMNSHYATPTIDTNGNWTNHISGFNISADVSCTGGQMARALGLAFASKKYRANEQLKNKTNFSKDGNEVCFCTIGDASTSEGIFWETMNAAAVLQVPLAVSVWDDGYGISVPKKYQTLKESISEALKGFQTDEKGKGIEIYKVKGYDYPALRKMYEEGINKSRIQHTPVLFHVEDLTQPQGHSTSGSHERYKTKERLDWEKEHDCIRQMRHWMISEGIATTEELDKLEAEAKVYARRSKNNAWKKYMDPVRNSIKELETIYTQLLKDFPEKNKVEIIRQKLRSLIDPTFGEVTQNARRMFIQVGNQGGEGSNRLKDFIDQAKARGDQRYHTNLYSSSQYSALKIPVIPPVFRENAPLVNGFKILNHCFDEAFQKYDNLFAFGEDVGHIGDVNQGMAEMQKKYGLSRVFDTGIREWSIMGQAIGMAMRGLRPIAEIQYLDYLLYGFEPLSDDLATLRYRTNGIQQAPVIIRTRGHRLEGIWHSGSPLGMMIHAFRGMYICVPRNMTQAAGMYNTLLRSDDPAIVIECLNGYRLKERLPDNIGEFTIPLGVPEILEEGTDVTLVTYGSCVRIAQEGIELLKTHNISVELIDVQTLLPFDLEHQVVASVKKTNRIVFMDEDVPGGATAYMMQEVLEKQNAYEFLDSKPMTITAAPNRPPYGSEGDYFSKPNPEDVFDVIYEMMAEADPAYRNGE